MPRPSRTGPRPFAARRGSPRRDGAPLAPLPESRSSLARSSLPKPATMAEFARPWPPRHASGDTVKPNAPPAPNDAAISDEVAQHAPREAAELLAELDDARIARVLEAVNPQIAQQVLDAFDEPRRRAILERAPADTARQWTRNQ